MSYTPSVLLMCLIHIYPRPTFIRQLNNCNVLPCTTLKYLNIFIPFLTYLPAWITNFPTKIQLKPSLLRIIVFIPPQSSKSLRKTATRHFIERSFRNQRVSHIFCKRTPPPSCHKVTCVHWGYKFLWISAVLPVSWATVLRFNCVRA